MSIKLDETIVAVWFVNLDETTDWMAGVNRTDEGWELQYRFRYYNSEDPWDPEDKKSWYRCDLSNKESNEADAIDAISQAFEALKEASGGEAYALIRGESTHEQFVEEFRELPFTHARVATAEEITEFDLESA